jgi:hypothetical protein
MTNADPDPLVRRLAAALRCKGYIEKRWPGHRAVLWRRQCGNRTQDVSGYCHVHRICHHTVRD